MMIFDLCPSYMWLNYYSSWWEREREENLNMSIINNISSFLVACQHEPKIHLLFMSCSHNNVCIWHDCTFETLFIVLKALSSISLLPLSISMSISFGLCEKEGSLYSAAFNSMCVSISSYWYRVYNHTPACCVGININNNINSYDEIGKEICNSITFLQHPNPYLQILSGNFLPVDGKEGRKRKRRKRSLPPPSITIHCGKPQWYSLLYYPL